MDVNYERLRAAIEETIESLKSGTKVPDRRRRVALAHIANLESEMSTGEYSFRSDASVDAGGGAKHPRPMDYLLGGLLSCQQMWCMRWAALKGFQFSHIALAADGKFTWRGEYLDEVNSGLMAIVARYQLEASGLTTADVLDMADTVGRRCPVFATLRKATVIEEEIMLNGALVSRREWRPGHLAAFNIETMRSN
jgi:uncharacterized OsmC-like protein